MGRIADKLHLHLHYTTLHCLIVLHASLFKHSTNQLLSVFLSDDEKDNNSAAIFFFSLNGIIFKSRCWGTIRRNSILFLHATRVVKKCSQAATDAGTPAQIIRVPLSTRVTTHTK